MTSPVKFSPKPFGALAAVSLLLVGCSSGQAADVEQLTIVTTSAVLDQATSMAVSQYVQDQGITAEIQDYEDSDAVFEALEAETADDHAVIGIVTAQQEPDSEDQELQLPDDVEIVSQAPADLGLAAAASTMTSAQFTRDQQESTEDDAASELQAACDGLTWIHAETPADEVDTLTEGLAEQGCSPEFETTAVVDTAVYDDITGRLKTEPDTVAMLYSLDPVIVDQGLTALDVETDSWSRSNVVAVAPDHDDDEVLAQDITAVFDEIDSESATELLRGFHDSRRSVSDLDYEVDHAIRHWLAQHDLLDSDTVTDNSTDTDE